MSTITQSVSAIAAKYRESLPADASLADLDCTKGLLNELEEAGFADVAVPESRGGSGGDFSDLEEVIRGLAYEGVFLPIAQRNVGAWILADGGIEDVEAFPASFVRPPFVQVRPHELDSSVGVLSVPLLGLAQTLITPSGSEGCYLAVSLSGQQLGTAEDYNLLPAYSGTLRLESGRSRTLEAKTQAYYDNAYSLLLLIEAEELIAALYRISVDYAQQREQFGRPISSFPAVQDLLIELAQASAVSNSACNRAREAWFTNGSESEISAAAWLVADGAMKAIRAAHQVHGAIGMTEEFHLSRYTKRLHQLRNEIYGDWEHRSNTYLDAIHTHGFMATLIDSHV